MEQSETAWRRESLLRYRWIPIFTASGTLWIFITFLAVVAGIRRRVRAQQVRKRWAEAEAEEDRAAAIEAETEGEAERE